MPLFITVFSAAAALLFYTVSTREKDNLVYIQGIFNAFLPLIFIGFRKILKKEIPIIIDFAAAIYIVLASNFGTTLSFYGKFPFWDLFMHGLFGLVAALVLYILIVPLLKDKAWNIGFLSVQFLAVMGAAALWEIFEYTSDIILGGDTQRVQVSISEGVNPVKDTMTDIIITAAGFFLFHIGLYIKKKAAK
ncbi:MAG: hypothetical protein J6K88_06280 [Oscillospiraceae bacterium]|nr:hypothetical protein [Oscillospiraceae bacterium]